mmetsp:Transcript_31583/g.90605  ORF Transcript_31583/g.90605 Transcript_31583/m.90605 type:complete len:98 (+) Transcript_31583:1632-1925(+)
MIAPNAPLFSRHLLLIFIVSAGVVGPAILDPATTSDEASMLLQKGWVCVLPTAKAESRLACPVRSGRKLGACLLSGTQDGEQGVARLRWEDSLEAPA